MFGPDDAFLTTLLRLLRQLPIYPMFGRGLTRQSQERCRGRKRMRSRMSAAVLASTLTRNFSEPLHTKPALNPP
jgi:hypothetical protein